MASLSNLYNKNNSLTRNDAGDCLDMYGHLLRWKTHKETVLDVGCGEGGVTKNLLYPYIEDYVEELVAIDKVEGMIDLAYINNRMKKIYYKVADIMEPEDIEKIATKFDHIFSFYCTHWIMDQRTLMKNLYNLLNSDGQIFLTANSDSPIRQSYRKMRKNEKWARYLPHKDIFASYSDDAVKYLRNLEQTGFDVDLCETIEMMADDDNYEGLVRWISKTHLSTNPIPEELRQEYIEEHLENACYKFKVGDGYRVPYETIVVIASKKMNEGEKC